MAKRTTHRSTTGTKLYAVRDSKGEFTDIQTFKKAHGQDVKRTSQAEVAAKAVKTAKPVAVAAPPAAAPKVAAPAPKAAKPATKPAMPKPAAPPVAAPKAAKPAAKKTAKKAAKKK